MEYIHHNPVKAGFVEKPEDYLYKRARDYYGMQGLIEIGLLDPLIITVVSQAQVAYVTKARRHTWPASMG